MHRGVVVPFPALVPLLEPEEEGVSPFFVSWGLTVMSLVLTVMSLLPKRVVERTAREQERVCVVPGQVSPWKPVSHGLRNEISSSKEKRNKPPVILHRQKAEESSNH